MRLRTLLVLDLGLDIGDRVGRLDVQRDCLAREGLDKDLPAQQDAIRAQFHGVGRQRQLRKIEASAALFR